MTYEFDELVLFNGVGWAHLDEYIRTEATLAEASQTVQDTLDEAGKAPRFRALRDIPPFSPQMFAPMWDRWSAMRVMGPPHNIVPAGIAMVSFGLRNLDHPEWSSDTHIRVATGFLRGAVAESGYTLAPCDFGALELMFKPRQVFLTGHDEAIRDTLITSMRAWPNGW
ncbi:hypothetical protein ACFWVM_33840 [Nocardia fluminea]|uniref:hypothetical protein n=1 Tax=Nocardia fluminea TaxID=134984 RepID=UPI00364DA41D